MRSLLALIVLLMVVGCGDEAQQPVTSDASVKQPSESDAPAMPPMASQPSDPADEAKLAALEKEYKNAKSAYEKDSKDAKLKAAYVDATVKFGHESMMSATLPQRVKYKQALGLYREALKLDPKNKVALQESALIVDIYKQMGRPVPEG